MKRHLTISFLLVALGAGSAFGERLPRVVVPEEYKLVITPLMDLEYFLGSEVITVAVSEPVTEITLHSADLTIDRVYIRDSARRQRAKVELDEARTTMTLRVRRELVPGSAEIRISFRGRLRNDLRGLYLSKSAPDTYLFTQLQPIDARRFFPCFDEPDLKARFDLSVIADVEHLAISNTRIISSLPGPTRGTRRVRFETTPPMSTYMLALAVGPFDCLSSKRGDMPVRLCTQRSLQWKGRTTHRAVMELLDFYEDWFGVPYPFGKLDVVALPDMAAGGMENPGAIFLREGWALVDEDAPLETRRWAATLLAHEVSHLWVGDLVTMKWWSDVWLNEGLATWLSGKALRALNAGVDVDEIQTFRRMKSFEVDSYGTRKAVAAPIVDDESLFELFDVVTNEKPAAMMAMLEQVVGEAGLRRLFREYLVRYSWGSASTSDFVASVEDEFGEEAAGVINDYVSRPAFPVIEVSSRCVGNANEVRFTERANGATPWRVPVCYRTLSPEPEEGCVVVAGERAVSIEGGCNIPILVNPGVPGYYRVLYSGGDHARIADATSSLSALEKLTLLDNEWWLVNEGHQSVGSYLELLERGFSRERHPAVVSAIVGRLTLVERQFVVGETRGDFVDWTRAFFRTQLQGVGVAASADESPAIRKLRGELLWGAGVLGRDPKIAEIAREYVREFLDNPGAVDPAMADVMIHLAARSGDEALYNVYLSRVRRARDTQESYRFLMGLTSFTDPELVQRTLELTMTDVVQSQDASSLIGRLLSNPETAEAAWPFIRERWPHLEKRMPVTFTSERVVFATGSFCSAEKRSEVASFFETNKVAPKTLQMSLARIDRCVARRPTQSVALATWLSESSRMAKMQNE